MYVQKERILDYIIFTVRNLNLESKMAKRNKIQNKVMSHVKAQRGLDRKEFFANGGDFRQWIHPRIIIADKKKRASKNACRGKHRG